MKAILVFCEGEHDIAFVCRALIASGDFERDDTKIGDLPGLVKNILVRRFQEREVEKADARKYAKARPPVLGDALKTKESGVDVRLWFFCAFGQDQHSAVGKFIEQFKRLRDDAIERGEDSGISSMAFAFLYDADEEGVPAKLAKWRQNYKAQFPGIEDPPDAGWQSLPSGEDTQVGVCILRGAQQTTGELEDIVLPMMKTRNEPLYSDAVRFIDTHWRAGQADKKKRKAAITAAGQIHSPSCSMAVILRDTPHLQDDALRADPVCQGLVHFFKDAYAVR